MRVLAMGTSCLQSIRISAKAGVLAISVLLAGSAYDSAHALDVDADDYGAGALPAGTNLGLIYFQHATRNKVYSGGDKVSGGNLTSDISILRYAHFIEIGPFLLDPQFLLPIGRLHGSKDLDGLGTSSGVGDLILASTIWLYRNNETAQYFGVTPIIYAPIGRYHKADPLNLGENRWKFGFQTGYSTALLTKDLVLQLAADVTWFGRNNDFGAADQTMKQKPLYSLQGWLKYNVNKDFDIRLGSTLYTGGETRVDGVDQNDKQRTVNIKFGFAWNFAPTWNVMALYGRDLDVKNGPKEANRINLRLLKAF